MWNRINKILVPVVAGCSLLLLWMVWDLKSSQQKFGFVMIDKVFEGFDMKKELQNEFESNAQARIAVLDSLELKLKFINSTLSEKSKPSEEELTQLNFLQRDYVEKREEILLINQRESEEFDRQIFQQINQYISEYGKENGYTYLFGTDGSGSLMYADGAEDVTDQVIVYINDKYNGKN
jgi:outer membrane protein